MQTVQTEADRYAGVPGILVGAKIGLWSERVNRDKMEKVKLLLYGHAPSNHET